MHGKSPVHVERRHYEVAQPQRRDSASRLAGALPLCEKEAALGRCDQNRLRIQSISALLRR